MYSNLCVYSDICQYNILLSVVVVIGKIHALTETAAVVWNIEKDKQISSQSIFLQLSTVNLHGLYMS